MSTTGNIDTRLSDFTILGNDIVEIITQIINDNFDDNNIDKAKRSSNPMVRFVDSEYENVSLDIAYVDANPIATIKISDSDFPVSIKVTLDHSFFDSIPQEIADYLQE